MLAASSAAAKKGRKERRGLLWLNQEEEAWLVAVARGVLAYVRSRQNTEVSLKHQQQWRRGVYGKRHQWLSNVSSGSNLLRHGVCSAYIGGAV